MIKPTASRVTADQLINSAASRIPVNDQLLSSPESIQAHIELIEQKHTAEQHDLLAQHDKQNLQLKNYQIRLDEFQKNQQEQLKSKHEKELAPLKEKLAQAEAEEKKRHQKTIAGYPISELLKAPLRPPQAAH